MSVLFVANLWKKLRGFRLYMREMCTGLWIGSAHLLAALGGPECHAVAVGASARASSFTLRGCDFEAR